MSDLRRWTGPVSAGGFRFRPPEGGDGIPSRLVVRFMEAGEDGPEQVGEKLRIRVDPTRVER